MNQHHLVPRNQRPQQLDPQILLAVNFNKITEETNTQKYDIIIKYE